MINKQIHIPKVYEPDNEEEKYLDYYRITGVSIRPFTDQEMDFLRQQIIKISNQIESPDSNLREQHIVKINVDLEMILCPKSIQILVENN
ncbi:MAG: hypothetical protein UDQ58_03635 [Desulfovibrio sp.]|nr:hypothetical protein [Desulfovibrio sp.]